MRHRPEIHTSKVGSRSRCRCGWVGNLHRVSRGWLPGGLQVERDRAQHEWAMHIRDTL